MQVRAEQYMTGDVLTCLWFSEDMLTSQRIASCCGDAQQGSQGKALVEMRFSQCSARG